MENTIITKRYAYDYMSIRHKNIKEKLQKEHEQLISNAAKYHANIVEGFSRSTVYGKSFSPKAPNIRFAEDIYGNWKRDWENKTFEEMLDLLRINDKRISGMEDSEFDKAAEKEIKELTDAWNTKEMFQWNDPLNYQGLEHTDYNIFLDLFYRDSKGNYTLFYNTESDTVEYKPNIDDSNGIVFTKGMLREVYRDYAKPFTEQQDRIRIVNDVYDNRIRSNYSIYAYSPLRDWVNGLVNKWDGTKRLDTLFIDHLGADDTPLTRKITRYWFINAIRCLHAPCKHSFQHMLVLVGESNCGKSCVMEKLFTINDKSYYTYEVAMNDTEQKLGAILASKWALGFSERTGITKEDNNQQKKFMDLLNSPISYLKKYQNEVTVYKPHNCVFVTTNDRKLLNDYTVQYNKRYWILNCHGTEKDFLEKNGPARIEEVVEQVWAEAQYYYLQDPDAFLELNEEDVEQLRKFQTDYQTITQEEVTEKVAEIVNQDYYVDYKGKGDSRHSEFENESKFVKQVNGDLYSIDTTLPKQRANCIPVRWLRDYCKKYLKWDSRYDNFFKQAMEDLGWSKKVVKMFGKSTKCYFNLFVFEGEKNSEDEEITDYFKHNGLQ